MGTRVLEVELTRKEKRWQKEKVARNEDQKVQRAVNAEGDTPVEQKGVTPSASSKAPADRSDATKRVELRLSGAKNDSGSPESRMEYPITTEAVRESQIEPQTNVELQQSSSKALDPQPASTTDEVPTHFTNDFEGTAGSLTDPYGGSDWSVHGDDLHSSRSLSGYTPASSMYGDEGVDEPTPTGLDALKSPLPPLPSIPEACGLEAVMYEKDAEPQLASQSGLGQGHYRRPYVQDDTGGGD
jgi:hypothetical protein